MSDFPALPVPVPCPCVESPSGEDVLGRNLERRRHHFKPFLHCKLPAHIVHNRCKVLAFTFRFLEACCPVQQSLLRHYLGLSSLLLCDLTSAGA